MSYTIAIFSVRVLTELSRELTLAIKDETKHLPQLSASLEEVNRMVGSIRLDNDSKELVATPRLKG